MGEDNDVDVAKSLKHAIKHILTFDGRLFLVRGSMFLVLVLFSISAENLCLMCAIVEDFCIYGLCFHEHLNCFNLL